MLHLKRKNQKAFSLIEAAIVLGVIGLVLGGIWVAASAIQERQRVNDFLELFTVAYDTARTTAKSYPSDTSLSPILSRMTLPGGYREDDGTYGLGFYTNGRPIFVAFQNLGGQFRIELYFEDVDMNIVYQPKFCTEIAKSLLSHKDLVQGTLYGTPNVVVNSSTGPPSVTSVAATCATGRRISAQFRW